jgi:hypothetical protein
LNLLIISLLILPSIVAIGIIDYAFLSRWLKCEHCTRSVSWKQFILPTLIEFFMFIIGVYVGYQIGLR